jgi:para-nitrobenzyl esterase
MNEDYLTLNIWTPARSARAHLPVMVWLHGGNFTVGTGSAPNIDGTNLARRGVGVVTLNYRLGALGFLAHPALSQESEKGTSGNYGLLDQIAALKWVQANVAAFGGNSSSVTLVGQSAGATGVGDLLVSPLARGLFHRGILQSIGGSFGNQASLVKAEREGGTLVPDIATFRRLSFEEVIARLPQASAVSPQTHYYPVIDGRVLPANPVTLMARGQARVPLLVGHNSDEALFWARDLPTTVAGYREYVRGWFRPEFLDEILARYPAVTDGEVAKAVTSLTSDFKVVTPTIVMARAASQFSPVYMYRFSRVSPAS